MILKWLYQTVNPWDDILNKDILDHLFEVILMWIEQQEVELIIERNIFNIYFYIFIYSNQTDFVKDEYYNIKYSEDMVDLFLELKEITKSYGSQLLHEKNRTSNDLFHFIFTYVDEFNFEIEDDINDILFYEVD